MKKTIHLLLANLLFAGAAIAQQGYYQFSQTSEQFFAVLPGPGNTISTNFSQQAYLFTLPRPLQLFDKPFGKQIVTGKNGYIVATGATYSFAIDPCIMGLNAGPSSSLSYFYEAKDNDSVFVVQWLNMVPDSSNPGDFINFQAKIFLKGQHVQFHYGPSKLTSAKYVQGRADISTVLFLLSTDFTTAYEAYTVYGDPAQPGISTDPNSTGLLNAFPAEGTVYNFRKKSGLSVQETPKDIFSIYPNPANTTVSIHTTGNIGATGISITNTLGQQVYSTATFTCTVDISGLTTGIYFLNIETEKGVSTYKLLKE